MILIVANRAVKYRFAETEAHGKNIATCSMQVKCIFVSEEKIWGAQMCAVNCFAGS